LWGASAYKGADRRGDAELPDVPRRVANALAWSTAAPRCQLAGLIATGWSRYQTARVQCEPIDGALDALVRTAAVFRDGRDIGAAAAESFLAAVGEYDTFQACRSALARFAQSRRATWEHIRLIHEQGSLERRDPRRQGSGVLPELRRLAREQLASTQSAADAVAVALTNLLPRSSIESFLAERTAPLTEMLERL
jgi:hypothetical protein